VDGISFRSGEKIVHNKKRDYSNSGDLDSAPFVSKVYKEHLDIKNYFLNHSFYPMVQIITSRGCPNNCTFCSWTETLTGRTYRARSVNNIVDEFEYITIELPQVKEIFIEDDSFTIDKERVREFCLELGKRDISISWSCQSRATLDYSIMKLMKDSGCRLLDVGYESGSNEMLMRIRKGTTTDQLLKFTRDAKKAHLKILADFVIGFHGETKEMADQTLQFIKQVRPDLLQIAVATPIPGTEFYNWCRANGYLLSEDLSDSVDDKGFQKCLVSYPWFTNKEIEGFVSTSLREYYLSPSYLALALKGIIGRHFLDEVKIVARSSGKFLSFLGSEKDTTT
jgi:anaerobic magnesium-protoporphyrin IX monomethyl ester cyclase